jgi:hypothetical protein
MNIVFLDIDGVLNGTNFLQASVWPVVKENQFWVMALNNLDSRAVELLNELLAKTGSKVVVSSSWRHAWKQTQIQSLLCEKGFNGEILDMTPIIGDDMRAIEIRRWLYARRHETIKFVILDDDPVEGFGELFVKTDKKTGLTQCDVDRCVALLK